MVASRSVLDVPIYTFTTVNEVDLPVTPGTCGGLHGHVRVSPDGTTYVPNENCMDASGVSRPGVAVSMNNGLSWSVRTVPDGKSISPRIRPLGCSGLQQHYLFRLRKFRRPR